MKKRHGIVAQWILVGLFLTGCFNGCSVLQKHPASASHDHAYIVYWPPPKNSKQLRLAVKDNIDMKGVVTTAGSEYVAKTSPPAASDAECLAITRKRNVEIVGKANLSEFAVTPAGLNEYFGTPKNPFSMWRKLIPGGSSSGSGVAVANGTADVSFGTDTAGSIRVPAACCGIVGLKTTFGLVSLKGVFPIEPNIWIPSARWARTSLTSSREWIFCKMGLRHDTERQSPPTPQPGRLESGDFI